MRIVTTETFKTLAGRTKVRVQINGVTVTVATLENDLYCAGALYFNSIRDLTQHVQHSHGI